MGVILDILSSMAIKATMVVVVLNVNVSLHTLLYKKTSQAVVNRNISFTSDAIRGDLKNIGLNTTSVPMLKADPTAIKFLADIDGNASVDTVHYYLGSTSELSGTDNPYDQKMYRVLGNGQAFDFASGVVNMNFEYYDINGLPTTDLSLIKSINIELQMENGYAFDGAFPSAYWESHIFPANL